MKKGESTLTIHIRNQSTPNKMKKFFAIAIICVFTANVTFTQPQQPQAKMKPCSEKLYSADKDKPTKGNKTWEKQKKENEKKWRKHLA